MAESHEQNQDVLFERRGPGGRLGVITLNRPRQINALTFEMLLDISTQLAYWREDDGVEQYLLVGAGERGLCAGGDIREIREDVLDGTGGTEAAKFFAGEYRLDAGIAELEKPAVAIMDGITFGGGVGIAAHSRGRRIVTERSRIAMPETGIGFIPDVGGSRLLGRMPGELGMHAGLTGAQLTAGDAIAGGLADTFIASDRLPQLIDRLEREDADAVIADLAGSAPASPLAADREWIDAAYGAATVAEMLERLDDLSATYPSAGDAAHIMRGASPTSLAVTAELIRRNRESLDLRSALDLEYRVGMRLIATHDFLEGVRASIVDKDRSPKWQPASLAEVDQATVDRLFSAEDAPWIDWSLGPFAVDREHARKGAQPADN